MTVDDNVTVFTFGCNGCVVLETVGADNLVEPIGVAGVTGIALVGRAVAAAAAEILVI